MKFRYDDERLVIECNKAEREELSDRLAEDEEYFKSDECLYSFFESMVIQSELCWINPSDTGDLTEAPMLGILDFENTVREKKGPLGAYDIGMGEYAPILKRWAFVEYETYSPLEMLRATGKCIFISPK